METLQNTKSKMITLMNSNPRQTIFITDDEGNNHRIAPLKTIQVPMDYKYNPNKHQKRVYLYEDDGMTKKVDKNGHHLFKLVSTMYTPLRPIVAYYQHLIDKYKFVEIKNETEKQQIIYSNQ